MLTDLPRLLAAVALVGVWASLAFLNPSLALSPRALLLLNTLSAFLCPLWVAEDPVLSKQSGWTRAAFLATMLALYLGLAARYTR